MTDKREVGHRFGIEQLSKVQTEPVDLIGDKYRYFHQCENGTLPNPLQQLAQTIDWPVHLGKYPLHIACFFGDSNYSAPEWLEPHQGLDLQIPQAAEVVLPENCQVIYCTRPDERNLIDIQLWGRETKLAYYFAHLAPESIPKDITKQTFWNERNRILEKGESIGRVGKWPYELSKKVNIPPDVEAVYARNFDHLHFEVQYTRHPPGRVEYLKELLQSSSYLNPLLFLKPLCIKKAG